MDINLQKALDYSKNIMLKHKIGNWRQPIFGEYAPTYFFTTEHIENYLKDIDLTNKTTLSVLASGDHLFNLIFKDVKRIDAYDINKLSYFLYYAKVAIIKTTEYEDINNIYASFFSNDLSKWTSLLAKIKETSPDDVYLYYQELLDFCIYHKENLFLFLYLIPDAETYGNLYNLNKENYNTLRNNLEKPEINFLFKDIRTLDLTNKYALIILSNIADYLFDLKDRTKITEDKIMNLKEYIKSFTPYLEENGYLVNYFFRYGSPDFTSNDLNILKMDSKMVTIDERQSYYLSRKR